MFLMNKSAILLLVMLSLAWAEVEDSDEETLGESPKKGTTSNIDPENKDEVPQITEDAQPANEDQDETQPKAPGIDNEDEEELSLNELSLSGNTATLAESEDGGIDEEGEQNNDIPSSHPESRLSPRTSDTNDMELPKPVETQDTTAPNAAEEKKPQEKPTPRLAAPRATPNGPTPGHQGFKAQGKSFPFFSSAIPSPNVAHYLRSTLMNESPNGQHGTTTEKKPHDAQVKPPVVTGHNQAHGTHGTPQTVHNGPQSPNHHGTSPTHQNTTAGNTTSPVSSAGHQAEHHDTKAPTHNGTPPAPHQNTTAGKTTPPVSSPKKDDRGGNHGSTSTTNAAPHDTKKTAGGHDGNQHGNTAGGHPHGNTPPKAAPHVKKTHAGGSK